jgi:hypothetical protein
LVQVTLKRDIGLEEEGPLTDEVWMTESVEVEEPPAPRKRRKKYRRYSKPICTPEEKKALWEHQGRR